MSTITVGTENGHRIELAYEDQGEGQPVVLIHGFPFDGQSWERQRPALLAAGHRVITLDRRGFGRSSHTLGGYDYDTFADDLHQLIEALDLRDAILVGFSMGTGDVARYLRTHGSGRVERAVLIGSIPPFLLKTDDNPEGLDAAVFEEIKATIRADRYAYFEGLLADFFVLDEIDRARISDAALAAHLQVANAASSHATLAVIDTWLEDFRPDLRAIDVPVLVIQGTLDRNTPIDLTARRLPEFLTDLQTVEIEGGGHMIPWTHHDEVNAALLAFVGATEAA
ncbi:MAG: alpha/beta hydrolase [Solirubrobacteraceae bacterium]|nr:alpha/beta hydrolase [Patulibacter sp.]